MNCPRCGRQLKTVRAGQGERLTCEACGQINERSEPAPFRASPIDELLETALADLPPPIAAPRAVSRFPWLIAGGAALGLAAFAGAVALLASRLDDLSVPAPQIAVENVGTPSARKPQLPDWKPSWDMERNLALRVGFGRWNWRLPHDFEPASAPAGLKIYDGDFESWAWVAADAEATLAAFHLDSGEMKRLHDSEKMQVDSAKLDAALVNRLMRGLAKGYGLGELDFMAGDSGRLAGRKFQRVDFNGLRADAKRVYGVLLFSREGRSLLALVATSLLPPGDERRTELVSALLTLKLK